MSRLETPTGTKWGPFVLVGGSNPDKRPLSPLLARLAFEPGTKATYCPGPKGCWDKWPGTKACSVVVDQTHNELSPAVLMKNVLKHDHENNELSPTNSAYKIY